MNAAYVDEVVSKSLAGERSLYVSHVADPERYVQSIRQHFLDKRIVPALRTIIIQPHIVHLVDLPAGMHTVYFVTEDDLQSVFYDPASESLVQRGDLTKALDNTLILVLDPTMFSRWRRRRNSEVKNEV